MMRSMYSAISGLKAQQTMLDVTANNLANVNTLGYKAGMTTFQDALSQTVRGASASNAGGFAGQNAAQVGLGVTVGAIANMMGAGSFQVTGSTTDVAIQGDGWIRVGNGTPTAGNPTSGTPSGAAVNFTRSGNFTTNDKGYLITTDGYYVMGKVATDTSGTGGVADCYIEIPKGATDLAIANLLPVLTALDPAELLLIEGELARWQAAPHEQANLHVLHAFCASRLVTPLPSFWRKRTSLSCASSNGFHRGGANRTASCNARAASARSPCSCQAVPRLAAK